MAQRVLVMVAATVLLGFSAGAPAPVYRTDPATPRHMPPRNLYVADEAAVVYLQVATLVIDGIDEIVSHPRAAISFLEARLTPRHPAPRRAGWKVLLGRICSYG